MPPKRRPPAPAGPAKKRQSKLAKENNITAEQELEIREAFSLFAVKHPDFEDEKEGVLRAEDVRRCLIALNLTPASKTLPSILSSLDPTSCGLVPYAPFVSYCALALHSAVDSPTDNVYEEELHTAYKLFTHGSRGPITLAHLRRVARELREEVPDDVLRDMIIEANGGAGEEGIRRGVNLDDFEVVMKRAGVFN